MPEIALSPKTFAALKKEGESCWPQEACGLIFGHKADRDSQRVHPFQNMQNDLHTLDPKAHPRTAQTAYAMDPLKVERAIDNAEAAGQSLVAIFHSHPDYPAYFSDTDKRAAMPFGMPSYPQTWQFVLSVFQGKLVDIKGFYWNDAAEAWQEGSLMDLPTLPGPPAGSKAHGEP